MICLLLLLFFFADDVLCRAHCEGAPGTISARGARQNPALNHRCPRSRPPLRAPKPWGPRTSAAERKANRNEAQVSMKECLGGGPRGVESGGMVAAAGMRCLLQARRVDDKTGQRHSASSRRMARPTNQQVGNAQSVSSTYAIKKKKRECGGANTPMVSLFVVWSKKSRHDLARNERWLFMTYLKVVPCSVF